MPGSREISNLRKLLPGHCYAVSLDRKGKWLNNGDLFTFFSPEKASSPSPSLLSLVPHADDREWLVELYRSVPPGENRRIELDRERTGRNWVHCRSARLRSGLRAALFILENADSPLPCPEDDKYTLVPLLYRGIVHDLKTPLQYLRNNLTYLRERALASGEDPDLMEALDNSLTGTDKMEHLIRTLLEFQRNDTGRKDRFSLNTLLDNILILIRSNWKKSVEIGMELPPEELFCLGERFLIERALFNLIVNSCQALENEKRDTMGHIIIRGTARGSGLFLEIEDDGPGLSPDRISRIFEPGYTTKEKGHGLGLPMVRQIIEEIHGGSISAASPSGGGVVMSLFLPGGGT